MKTNIGNKVESWANYLEQQAERINSQNWEDMLGRQYPESFINEQQEQTHEKSI